MAEAQPKRRIGPLDSIGGVAREMRRVYRLAAREVMEVERASKLIYMLTQIRGALEAGDIERRIEALEAASPAKTWRNAA